VFTVKVSDWRAGDTMRMSMMMILMEYWWWWWWWWWWWMVIDYLCNSVYIAAVLQVRCVCRYIFWVRLTHTKKRTER
jgi:hypothetical protein